jgi:hypothetical protein
VGKAAAETHRKLRQTYGNEIFSKMTTHKWYKHLQSGRTSTDDKRCVQPTASKNESFIAQVKEVI